MSNIHIFNADQSGFNKEIHSGRTLAFAGEKQIHNVVQSVNSTTHSYTIFPIISKSGNLLSPLLIVYPKPRGKFGINVKRNMFQASNIYTIATKSGKMGSQELRTWLTEIYFKITPQETVLLVDSWSAFKNQVLINNCIPSDKDMHLFNIPPKTTALIQPLDKYGFRLWKNFVRKFSNTVLIKQINIHLYTRDNIFKLQAITHNQFSSPRFIDMWKYSWYSCGYTDSHPGHFQNPVDFVFHTSHSFHCSLRNCSFQRFAKCSWCCTYFCFEHYFTIPHLCNTFIP